MSKGWESKSVAEQQNERAEQQNERVAHTRPAVVGTMHPDQQRQRQALELQRERILSERTSSAHRRSALTNALADIEEKLAELGRSIHL